MPKGGARVRTGPAPNPNSLRQNPADWTHLPAAGRDGPAPAFPLDRPAKRELEVWESEWKRPQAIMWERLRQEIEVAMYVRSLVDAESPVAKAESRTLVIRLMGELGITVGGLAKNRWIIDVETSEPVRETPSDDRRGSARQRFRALEGGRSA